MSKERRMELIELAAISIFIIEDDSFGEIYFEDAIIRPQSKVFDKDGHVIYIKGFSKTLAPGLRIAALIADGPILNGYMQ